MVIVYQTKKEIRKSKTDMSLTMCYDNKQEKKKHGKNLGLQRLKHQIQKSKIREMSQLQGFVRLQLNCYIQ